MIKIHRHLLETCFQLPTKVNYFETKSHACRFSDISGIFAIAQDRHQAESQHYSFSCIAYKYVLCILPPENEGYAFRPVCQSFCSRGGGLCLSAWWDTHTRTPAPREADNPPCAVHAGRYGQQAGGTHPTGMHTCASKFRCLGEKVGHVSAKPIRMVLKCAVSLQRPRDILHGNLEHTNTTESIS